MSLTSISKPSLTFDDDFALTYIKGIPNRLAKAKPSSIFTALYSTKSLFVAIRILVTSLGALDSICVIHFSIFSKDCLSIMEYVNMIPAAPL